MKYVRLKVIKGDRVLKDDKTGKIDNENQTVCLNEIDFEKFAAHARQHGYCRVTVVEAFEEGKKTEKKHIDFFTNKLAELYENKPTDKEKAVKADGENEELKKQLEDQARQLEEQRKQMQELREMMLNQGGEKVDADEKASESDIANMAKPALQEYIVAHKLEIDINQNKPELIAAIIDAQK